MQEYTIEFSKKNRELFLCFWKKFEQNISLFKNVIIKNSDENIALVFMVQDKNKQLSLKMVKTWLSDSIVVYYKTNYLKENLKVPASLSLRFDILCTALAIFDKSSDVERVLNSMQFKTNFNVDSYFRFVLSDLRNKWQDICDLFYNNLPELVSSDAFYELMKYLIKITETALDFVFVSIADNNVYIKDIAGKLLVPPIEIKSNDVYTSVILELVSLAPANIVLNFAQDGAQDLGSCLQNLFDSKVVYST